MRTVVVKNGNSANGRVVKNALLVAAFTLGAFLAAPLTSQAVVLDWDSVAWADGSKINSYDVDGDGTLDIRVAVTGDIGFLFLNSPRTGTDLTGGVVPAQKSLIINSNHATTSTFVTVTIDFYNVAGVLNPTFSIYDIDTGAASGAQFTWQDQIRNIQASFGATTYAPTFSALGTAVSSAPNTLTGTANVDETNSGGNATISFTGGPVSRIQFDYGPGPDSIANPDGQVVSVSDISFNNISGVPEINTVWVALGALLLAAMFQKMRQRNNAESVFLQDLSS